MAKITRGELSVEVPEGWTVVENEGPLAVVPPDGDGALQLSFITKPLDRRSQPTEKSASSWVHRTADKLTGGDVRTRAATSQWAATSQQAGTRLVEGEAWRLGNSVCAWIDLEPPTSGKTAGKQLAVGFREWEDAALLLTWIADGDETERLVEVRRIFDDLIRVS